MTDQSNDPVDGEDLISRLRDSTVLTEDGASGDVDLTEGFRRDWRRRIEHLRTSEPIDFVALLLDTDPDSLTIDETDEGVSVERSGTTIGEWPSEAALVADVAAFVSLDEWLSEWDEFDGAVRDELVARLRVFLEACPTCDGDLDKGGPSDEAATPEAAIPERYCVDCGAALF